MTTLPQNAPMRMPRSPMAVGYPPVGSVGAGAAPAGMTGSDVVRVLRGNLPLIVILLAFSTAVGFVVNYYLAKNYSRYTATGYCEISAPTAPLLFGRSEGFSEQNTAIEQRTQVQTMLSEALFDAVLQNPNSAIRNTTWFKSFDNKSRAREDLVKNFSASAIPETRLIRVAMNYSVPEDAKIIVQEVVDEHLRRQGDIALARNFDRTQTLNIMRARLESDLRSVAQDRREQAARLSQAGIPLGAGVNFSSKQAEFETTTKTYLETQEELAKRRAFLDQLNASLSQGQDPPALVRQVEADPEYINLQRTISDIDLRLKSNSDYGSASPQILGLTRQRESLQQRADELKKSQLAKLKASVPEETQAAIRASEATLKELSQRLDGLKSELGELANVVAQYQSSAARESSVLTQLREVNTELDQQSVTSSARGSGSTMAWAIRPITPETPSFPKLPVTLTMAITLGLLLALGIAFLRELMNTTIRSPRDVAKIGPIPVLGMLPHEDDDPQSVGARLPLVIAEAPQSMTAEQLRQIRTRLQHSASLDTTRSLLVTSGNPGDGKTTVAVNLAAGLALVGRRILLVDANFRRPELHKLFGIDATMGFSTALAEPSQIATAAKATKVPNLMVLPAGPKPANATEMLESTLLQDFIDKALESYDHVVFDSGPLLLASETVALAPRVDGVVTVVRAHQSTRGVLARVKDTLRQIKAESLGVVINGIRSYAGGYYGRNIKTYYEYSANGNG